MLSIRPNQRCTNSAVSNRMKPPRQIRSIRCWSSADCRTASNAARSLPKGRLSMAAAAIPLCLAFSRPPASDRFEITTTISAGKSASLAASISPAMFDPRPEIRMATRRFIASPRQIEMTVIDHAMLTLGLDHLAQQRDVLSGFRQNVGNLGNGVGSHQRNHADTAVEGAQQFKFSDTPLLRQPLEYRQHRKARKINPDAEMLWQHAGNVIGKAAAGDVGEALDRAGFADRSQARSDIKPRRRQQRATQRHDR